MPVESTVLLLISQCRFKCRHYQLYSQLRRCWRSPLYSQTRTISMTEQKFKQKRFQIKAAKKSLTAELKELRQEIRANKQLITGTMDEQLKQTIIKSLEEYGTDILPQGPSLPENLVLRPPVVTIMGHVDHGKTTLLDALRQTRTVDKEFGGITQHIGAFSVTLPAGDKITFLDTPGHAVFKAMRQRGANVTDIVVLVVAADDAVMEQTVESINYANEAGVPIIVAINKIDKPAADVEYTKNTLAQHGILVEDLGGDIQAVPISALKGTNLLTLQEAIVTQAELMDLKGDPTGLCEGHVIESRTDPGKGKLASVIIKRGKLKKGSLIIAGTSFAKVRNIYSDQGKPVKEASLSAPVEVIGWKDLPNAGDEFLECSTEKELKSALRYREELSKLDKTVIDLDAIKKKQDEHLADYQILLAKKKEFQSEFSQKYFKRKALEKDITLNERSGPSYALVLKGDVDGSVDAILDVLESYKSEVCHLDILHYGVGHVTEGDVSLAQAFDGDIYTFNVQTPNAIKKDCEKKSIKIKEHNIIYRLFEDLMQSINDRLPTKEEELITGEAQVLEVFSIKERKKTTSVAGCRCIKGPLQKEHQVKVIRYGEIVYSGSLSSMKHHKKEVTSIDEDTECGLAVSDENFQFQKGDEIQFYRFIVTEQTIDWNPGF